MTEQAAQPALLGPFVGFVDETSARIWLQYDSVGPDARMIYVSLHSAVEPSVRLQVQTIDVGLNECRTGIAHFTGLSPDSTYAYGLWHDSGCSVPIDLAGLAASDLRFRTMASNSHASPLDFLILSCHNPEAGARHGRDPYAMWKMVPHILEHNPAARFAILAGDQVYADEIETAALKERDDRARLQLYITVYRKFWSDISYRKVLCRLPSVLMWDDHDITDGWGSREDSFAAPSGSDFLPEWQNVFRSAAEAFRNFQAIRNPTVGTGNSFDTGFVVGRAGFYLADLRSNRNVRKHQLWEDSQFAAFDQWIREQQSRIDVLFFVTPVTFSHGDPNIDSATIKFWPSVLDWVNRSKKWSQGRGVRKWFTRLAVNWFESGYGDLRDDINDSWGSDVNGAQAQRLLERLFALQNQIDLPRVRAVILAGDIHTPGYSTLHTNTPDQRYRTIPHIVSTPVSYAPFSWVMEAIYRRSTEEIRLGTKGNFFAKVSHHFCHRSAVVVSMQNHGDGRFGLRTKFYLEGNPEPYIALFDLEDTEPLEHLPWKPAKSLAASPETRPVTVDAAATSTDRGTD